MGQGTKNISSSALDAHVAEESGDGIARRGDASELSADGLNVVQSTLHLPAELWRNKRVRFGEKGEIGAVSGGATDGGEREMGRGGKGQHLSKAVLLRKVAHGRVALLQKSGECVGGRTG